MWKSNFLRTLSTVSRSRLLAGNAPKPAGFRSPESPVRCIGRGFCSGADTSNGGCGETMSFGEAKKLLRLVNVEALKRKLEDEGKEVIGYSELLKICQSMGVSRSEEEAASFAKVLDDAGVVLLFRDRVYLHPHKVVDLVTKAVPLALTSEENDPRREELQKLQKKMEEIDMLAHRHVRRILWSGLGISVVQIGFLFRLTFWEFSWDVMEPITFFATATGLVIGYAYFLITSRDPSYQDMMKRLFLRRQRKLIKKHQFDMDRFLELQNQCMCHLDSGKIAGIRYH